MIKKALFAFLILCFLGPASVLAGEQVFQHIYAEKIYEPIPPAYHKIVSRLARWNHDAEAQLEKLEKSTHPKVLAWLRDIRRLDNKNGLELIKAVNRITNHAVTYEDDYHHYHKDYWAPPYETLTEGGDCEDIALLKAVAFHIHGWNVRERAHILIGMINFHGKETAHAVLSIDRGDGTHHVMRSIGDDVPTFDEMDEIMKPIYMMSSKNLILFDQGNTQRHAYNIFENGDLNFSTAAGENKARYND